jgi:hypothetical protein
MWKGMRTAAVLLAASGVLAAVGTSTASAALPEIGRCMRLKGTKEAFKMKFGGKFANRVCTRESANGNGKFEWAPGPGTEKEYESPGTLEPVNLETVGGTVIACINSKMFGEYTGAKTETDKIGLFGCTDTATSEPCQSLRSEETPPTAEEGTILSQAAEAELGFIHQGGKKPVVGWDYKPKTGSELFAFFCGPVTMGLPSGTPTVWTIEGSFIGRVVKPVNRMAEEFKFAHAAPGGKQEPEMFEGGAKATMTATVVKFPGAPITEQIGYSGLEEESVVEDYEIKASP